MRKQHKYQGFTLVELSLSIVVIGLIIGTILAAQTLVNQARLRTIASELTQMEIQVNSFHLEYNAIPGDIDNAHSYWGNNCSTIVSYCNGDGDNIVEYTSPDANNESIRYWQHLSLAELISGNYDGIGSFNTCDEQTCFFSKTGKSRYFPEAHTTIHQYRVPPIIPTDLLMFSAGPTGSSDWWYPSYTVPEAFNLDLKLDDGVANQGKLIAFHDTPRSVVGCADDAVGGSDYYTANLGDKTTLRCRIGYILR